MKDTLWNNPHYTFQNGFTMRWPGWQDPLSGIERYTWRVFRLRMDRDGNLTEVGDPVYSSHGNGLLADTYTPETAGMYSVYLQVSFLWKSGKVTILPLNCGVFVVCNDDGTNR